MFAELVVLDSMNQRPEPEAESNQEQLEGEKGDEDPGVNKPKKVGNLQITNFVRFSAHIGALWLFIGSP